MKKRIHTGFAALIVIAGIGLALGGKPELKPYGFIKGDAYFATNGATSWGQDAITCVSRSSGNGVSAVSFTAQHTRFGLKGSADAGNITTGGKLELDFFVKASDANAKPRIRQGYAWARMKNGFEVRMGQQWDVFSPLNPTTNNTNANLWHNGNYGFRRAMLQARYSMSAGPMMPNVQLCLAEGAREDKNLGADNLAKIPQVQGRVGLKLMETREIGVAVIYGAYGADRDYTTTGVSVDANVPVNDMISLKGEFALGNNFNSANLFTVSDAKESATVTAKNTGFWANVITKPHARLNTVIGFAQENISEPATTELESNRAIYGTLICPMGGGFSMSLEYEFITSTPRNGDANSSSVVDLAGKLVF